VVCAESGSEREAVRSRWISMSFSTKRTRFIAP
jgi:hypothetical protein